MNNLKTWKDGENLTAGYMQERGYKIVYRNFSCKIAELDIVAILSKKVQKRKLIDEFKQKNNSLSDKNEIKLLRFALKNRLKNLKDLLIITEVKARSNNRFGTGADAISKDKIRHMRNGAEVLLKMKQFKNMQVRFDVASVDAGEITYIEGAI